MSPGRHQAGVLLAAALALPAAPAGGAAELEGVELSVTASSAPLVRGSGRAATVMHPLPAFTQLVVDGGMDVRIKVDAAPAMTVSGDDNIVPLVRLRVAGRTATLDTRGSYLATLPVQVTLSLPALARVIHQGAGTVTLAGLQATSLALASTGAGDLRAAGRVRRLHLISEGSGDMDLAALRAREADVTAAGAGDVRLWVSGALRLTLTGSGDVELAGDARLERVERDGAGELWRR
ncbi:MAG TPA: DUF2807 domain-containing protein [Gammaproteobacteria bacterium]|nr:DUF2807 domain-containing protein [Gammaproteobacteria bacterium]